MTPKLFSTSPESIDADALAIVVFESGDSAKPPGGRYNELTGGLIDDLYASKEFTGKFLSTALIHRPAGIKARRLLLVGGGKAGESTPATLRQAAGAAVRALKDKACRRLALLVEGESSSGDRVQAISELVFSGDVL